MSDNDTANTAATAAAEAAVEQEQPAAAAASDTPAPAPRQLSATSALRKQLAEMAAQMQALNTVIDQERQARQALEQKLGERVSAQVAASPSAGDEALETAEIQPGQVANAGADVPVDETALPAAAASDEAAPPEAAAPEQAAATDAPTVETFEALMETLSNDHRALVEKHITGLQRALETERNDRKAAQKAIRTKDTELEQLKAGNAAIQELELRAAEAETAASFFEQAGTNNVKRGSMRLAFLAAQDGQFIGDDGAVQWDALQARFPDLFEGPTDRPAPDGALRGTAGKQQTVGSERPAPAPRTSASAGAGAGAAPPRRPFSMSTAIRSAAGRKV